MSQICRRVQDDLTTISISRKNHHFLLKLGQKGETFDDVLTRLLRKEGWKESSLMREKKPSGTAQKVGSQVEQSATVETKITRGERSVFSHG
jgi:hypothetical protein